MVTDTALAGGARVGAEPGGERGQRVGQLAPGDGALAVEGVVVEVVHHAGQPDGALLAEVPPAA